MINIVLNENTAEDVKCIQELREMGFSDEMIQRIYDMAYRPNGEGRSDNG
jgi:hypothetical protein